VAEETASVTKERAADAAVGPVLVRWTAPDALSNLVAVLELAADGQVRFGAASGRPTAATVKLVEDALVAGDFYDSGEPIAAFAWPLLIRFGGLAVLARGDDPSRPPRGGMIGTRLELSARGRATLDKPSYEALGALWARWMVSVSTDELARVEAIKGQRRPGTLTSAPARRAVVAAALATLEPGTWTGVGKVLANLRAQRPPLVATRSLRALWRLYVLDSYHGSLGHAGPRAWDLVEGRYALCVLFEYAATAGLIDVAYTDPHGARNDYRALWGADQLGCLSRYDGLVTLRVNDLGAAVLHDPEALAGLALPVARSTRSGSGPS
jgi:hypothetical protein